MKITLNDWLRVLDTMLRYKRYDGYVDFVDGKGLTLFDSDPCINGVHACYVTIEDVKEYMKED